MDAVDLLKHDHRMVEQLFRDYESAASDEQRRGVVELLVRELSKHAALEELLVYPLGKSVLPEGGDEVRHQLSGHMEIKQTLSALDRLGPGAEQERSLVGELQGEVEHHVRDEEAEFLPQLREAMQSSDLDELGQVLDRAKQTAPTRPHPNAPDEPPGLALAGPVAAAYDRLRDRLQGRPRT